MEKRNVIPDLRFPEFKEEWIHKKLADVCEKIQDGNYGGDYPKSSEFIQYGIPFLTSKAIGQDGDLIDEKIDFISKEKHEQLKKAQLRLHDILFTNRGASVGTIGIVSEIIANGNIGPQLTLLRSNDNIHYLFLKTIMTSPTVQKQIQSQNSGSAMNFFGIGETSKFKLNIPSFPEQQKIASFFTAIDQKISQLKQKKTLLEQYKKGVMQKIFSQEIRFRDDNGQEFPKWEKKRLGEVSTINPPTKNLSDEFIYIDLESVNKGELTKEVLVQKKDAPSRAQRVLEKDDILFQMVRPYQKNNLHFKRDENYVASTGYAQIKAKQSSSYIYHYLHLQEFVDDVIERCTGTSYPAINSKDLSKIHISYPTFPEQTKIANFLSAIDDKIKHTHTQIEKTELWKKGLLQKMLV